MIDLYLYFPRALALALCLVTAAAAQESNESEGSTDSVIPQGKPLLRSWSMEEYRGNSQNWDIAQGPDGLVYVGNGSSLLVFDGAGWRNIKTRNDGRVRDLEIDAQGRVWVASPGDFGYFQRDKRGALSYRSLSEEMPAAERGFGETRHVLFVGDDVYFNTVDRVYRWDGKQITTMDRWDGPFSIALVISDRYYMMSKGRLYDLTGLPPEPPEPESRWRWPDGSKTTFFVPLADGRMVMGTYDDGLYLLGDGPAERFNDDPSLRDAWPYRGMALGDGSILVSTINDGVFRIGADGEMLDWINRDAGLAQNTTTGMAIDHQGGLWLAQDAAIARVDLLDSLRVYDADLNVNAVRAIVEYQGELLTGGISGLNLLQRGDGAVGQAVSLNAPIQEVFGLATTPEGLLVSGHNGVQLMQVDIAGRTTTGELLLSHSYGYDLTASRFRNAYFVELDAGMGVLINNGDGWRGQQVEGLTERIGPLAESDDGTVWVGSGYGRFHHLGWEGDQLRLLQTLDGDNGVPEGNAHVFRVAGRLVFGTTRGGFRLSESGDSIEPDPLFGNEQLGTAKDVFRLEEAVPGQVLGVIGGVSDIWRAAVSSNGALEWQGPLLKNLNTGTTDFFTLARNQLWLSRLPELVRIELDELQDLPAAPSQVHVRQMGYTDTGDILLAGSGPSSVAGLLPYRRDALRFQYAMASYQQPDRNEYRVRLVGLEDEFSPWSRETRRDYTNLPGGDYSFLVEARDVAGQVSRSAPLTFSVQPPAYLSNAALAAYLAGALLLLWLAGWLGQRRRQAVLLARQQELETEVATRTREVRRQARELKALNESQSRFFANVSHEFRTPLTLARGPLEELASGRAGALPDAAVQHVAMALRNTQTLQGLIGQILDMKRLEAGEMPVSITRDNLSPLIREGVLAFVNQAEKQQVRLNTDGIADTVEADYDPGHMRQVIRNLVSNAMKFSPPDTEIRIELRERDGQVELVVQDQGPGIAADDLPRIFERYYQGDQTHASAPGTGIGLSLVKDLVELHQGEVSATSEPGHGACFTIRFPSELPELRQSPRPVVDPAATLADSESEDVPTILIVDDNQELRAFLSMRLSANYRIIEAADGEAGLAAARAEVPDAIVSDVMMPVMDGLQMTAALKADPETDFIPVLLLSARTTRRDAVAGLEQGAEDYLSKPFDTAELAARVGGMIHSRRRLLALAEEAQPPQRSAFLTQAHAVLDERLADGEFGPREWAAALHMDRTTLYRQFKKETDQAPEEYLREQRLLRAAELLKARAGNVSQVAMSVGFNSMSYFSRCFKTRFGVTPARFR
ncbi:MAG: ATP-binding protein [Xanthomonadales bacterium]|nr:ATP-binding protein [Xanthomonadales bacterium]